MYTHAYIYIHIYIYRERERDTYLHVCTYIHIYIYIYVLCACVFKHVSANPPAGPRRHGGAGAALLVVARLGRNRATCILLLCFSIV